MLKTYKYYIIIGLFLLYSFGVWHVSSTYTDSHYREELIAAQQQTILAQENHDKLVMDVGTEVEKKLSTIKITQQTIHQKVIHEVTKERVYSDCVTTPAGVQLIEDTIDNKAKSTR